MKTKVLICPDSFKGSLSAQEVALCIESSLKELDPFISSSIIPLADGGEGTYAILEGKYPLKTYLYVAGPMGKPVSSFYLSDDSKKKVFIESAKLIGLPLVSPEKRNPLLASSLGLGQAILKALKNGAEEICVSLGGSATCDAGMGMLSALGFKFYDDDLNNLTPNGENLAHIKEILPPPEIPLCKFSVLADVDNPLLGPDGAVAVFAPQKGAKEKDLPLLECGFENFVRESIASGIIQPGAQHLKGAGAAGGLGFAFNAFLKADIIKGIEFIFEAVHFKRFLKDCSLVITGEGKVDHQSLMGKVVGGVLQAAKEAGKPVIVIAGLADDIKSLKEAGIKDVIQIADPRLSLKQNMEPGQTRINIHNAFKNYFSEHQL